MVYLLFIFIFLYLNFKIEYRKNVQFLNLKMFDKLCRINNLDIKFILFFFFLVTLFTYTLKSIRWGPLHFHNIYRIVTIFVFYENKNTDFFFFFLVIQIQLLGYWKWKPSTSFLWWVPLKIENENKNTTCLTNQTTTDRKSVV